LIQLNNLSEEEIITLLQNEVKNMKQSKKELPILNTLSNTKNNPNYSLAKSIGKYLDSIGFYRFVMFVKNNFRIFPEYQIYEMHDFNKYYDIKFIENAFEKILNRKANEEEKVYYLNLLRSGNLSKTEIIVSIYNTTEAKQNNTKILGIKKRSLVAKIFQLPIFGYIFKSIFYLVTLPRFIRRINAFENHVMKMQEEAMQELQKKVDETKFEQELQKKVDETKFEQELQKKVDETKFEQELQKKVDETKFKHFQNSLKKNDVPDSYEISSPNYNTKTVNKSDDMYYSLFEMAFYNHDFIIEKQKIYLPYIVHHKLNQYHLDIGCGRGEFLSILKENHIKSKGIDINSVEINALKNKGYSVELNDAVSYLKQTNEKFSSISAFQVIEHLEYDYLKQLVSLAYQALNKDGILILETICPYNPVTINSFYMDETHKKLIPPELISFILQWVGFKDIKILFSSPLPKELRPKDDLLRSYHDYAVIGHKK